MKYRVKHNSDLNKKEAQNAKTQLEAGIGAYYVLDYKGNVYGRYESFEDASDHVDTLNEMEEL